MVFIENLIPMLPFMVCLFWAVHAGISFRELNKAQRYLGQFLLVSMLLFLYHAVYYSTNSAADNYNALNVIYSWATLTTYPLYYLYIKALRVELVNRHSLIILVRGDKQVEVYSVVYRSLHNGNQILTSNLLLAKCHRAHQRLALTLHEEALLTVDKYATNKITLVGITVELKRIREEVVYIKNMGNSCPARRI